MSPLYSQSLQTIRLCKLGLRDWGHLSSWLHGLPTAGSLGSLATARAAAHPCPVSSSVPTLVTSAHVTVKNLRLGEGYKHTLEHLGCGIESQLLTLLLTAGRYHHSAQNYFSLKITKLKGT